MAAVDGFFSYSTNFSALKYGVALTALVKSKSASNGPALFPKMSLPPFKNPSAASVTVPLKLPSSSAGGIVTPGGSDNPGGRVIPSGKVPSGGMVVPGGNSVAIVVLADVGLSAQSKAEAEVRGKSKMIQNFCEYTTRLVAGSTPGWSSPILQLWERKSVLR